MHHAHRGGFTPQTLADYLDRPQGLYIATFADGTPKVGTAIEGRRSRLDEQGPTAATFIASAPDGRVVRVLEDLVSSTVPIGQTVHRSRKLAGVVRPLPIHDVRHRHERTVEAARRVLGGLPLDPAVRLQDDVWQPPMAASVVLTATGPRETYPHDPTAGSHGLRVLGVLGQIGLVCLDGDDAATQFVADLGALRGRRLELGEFRSARTSVQTALF